MSRKRSRGPTCGVLIDVGSGSVGVGLVLSDLRNKMPVLVYTHREQIRAGTEPTVEDRVRALRQALFSATLELSNTGLVALRQTYPHTRPDRILVTCAAPWSRTVTQKIHYQEKQIFEVTHKQVENIVANMEQQVFVEEQNNKLLDKLRMSIVEKSVIEVMLNGYSVDQPYGCEAREVDIAHVTGLVPNDILEAITDIEDRILTEVETSVHTYNLVMYCVLRDLYPHVKNSLILDVTGEALEISVMRDSILLESITVLFGTHTLARKIAGELKTVPEEARTHMQSYGTEVMSSDMRARIDAVTTDFQNELITALERLSARYVLPQRIFMSIDEGIIPIFSSLFSRAYKEVTNTDAQSVVTLDKKGAEKLAVFDTKAKADQFLAVSARFFHKLHGCGEISN